MKKRNKRILTFYTDQQVCIDNIREASFSKSPLKPYLLMQRIKNKKLSGAFQRTSDFQSFTKKDFKIAHTESYVNDFFNGEGNCYTNGLPWSRNLVHSVGYTNASLYAAKRHALLNPTSICFAPISGMHHAQPKGGCGFCTFSGQVISAIKLYEEFSASGAYFDLDGHFGNSIEDSRDFNPILDLAIPRGCNINPIGKMGPTSNPFNEAWITWENLSAQAKFNMLFSLTALTRTRMMT